MSTSPESPATADDRLSRAVELTIRIGLVALLAVWCFQILRPFIAPVLWAAIIAVAVFPLHQKLAALLGERPRLAAGLLTGLALLLILIPIGLFAGSLVESAQSLREQLAGQAFAVPPPPANVADWPLIGGPLFELWQKAASNLGDTLKPFTPQLRSVGGWLLSAGAGAGAGILQFLVSLLIAGFFLASSAGSISVVGVVAKRLAGNVGHGYLALATQTIRSVAVGILGVAVIQASLLGAGFAAVGLPHAGIWTVLCLGLGVLQLPATLVVVPAIVYVFATGDSTVVSVLFTIWSLLAGLSDNVLKPILLGRGAAVPMIVIFLGAIGGFLWSGFIGLFVGAITLSLGYEMLHAWVSETADAVEAATEKSEPGSHAAS